MKIIIVGCGKVGATLAEHLNQEGHDITIIDRHWEKLKYLSERIDVMGVEGNGASITTQREAGVQGADILIATTNSDELNLLCCLIAKKAGNCQTIARIRDPEYYNEMRYIRDELNLSLVINPEQAAAAEIARIIKFPSAMKVDTFARGRAELIKLNIPEGSQLDGLRLFDMESKLHCKVLICTVERGEELLIPHGDFALQAGDIVSFIAPHSVALAFFKAGGANISNSVRSIMLIGGGKMSYYVAKKLEETKISVKIIEQDFEKCQTLSEMLPHAVIINGDGTDKQLLDEEGIGVVDAVGNFTGIDEENILLSLYEKEMSKAKLLTKINRITFEEVIAGLDIGSIINPNSITSDNIVRFVRALNNSRGSNVETLYKIAQGRAEALEFRVRNESKVVGRPLMELKLKPNVIIACITKGNKVVIPNGQSVIEKDDLVVVVSVERGLNDLEDILA
ncbi:MAG: Trk system potassium transporter TrkA [Lachnospiraceae bacterium]|nr:Trk system potassium transporter TrkA [Lachnospiraceae bacterium]